MTEAHRTHAVEQGRFACRLLQEGETCSRYARVTIVDADGERARACPAHAIAGLEGITGAHVDWADTKGLNEWETAALNLTEERARLAR